MAAIRSARKTMVKEHQCVKEVTEEHTFQGHNFSCSRHICTVSAGTPYGGVLVGSEGSLALDEHTELYRTLLTGRDSAVFLALGNPVPV